MDGLFPADENSRKAIVVLGEYDKQKCQYEPNGCSIFNDDETFIIEYPFKKRGEIPIALQNIIDAKLLRKGSILIQSPFDPDIYEEASVAIKKFSMQKHLMFSEFCKKLGSREVKVNEVKANHTSIRKRLNTGTRVKDIGPDIIFDKEESQRATAALSLHDTFEGGEADLQAAEDFLRTKGIWNDINMRSLLEARKEQGNNLLSRELVINLSDEVITNMRVGAKVSLPYFVETSINYEEVFKNAYEYTLSVAVVF